MISICRAKNKSVAIGPGATQLAVILVPLCSLAKILVDPVPWRGHISNLLVSEFLNLFLFFPIFGIDLVLLRPQMRKRYLLLAKDLQIDIMASLYSPFIWSIPKALITAELATTCPNYGGFVICAKEAFGLFWGNLMGIWKFLNGVINNAAYPVLCIDYLKSSSQSLFRVFLALSPFFYPLSSCLSTMTRTSLSWVTPPLPRR
ncbi:hypothetical protein NE237_009699 [Protea cynaroides]|uniref:Uncharacterized protein n=1 Tax=Protea cynaroides TaxID=273540 RepID=A0A9Q0KYE9_9MAGN|nr:hypothetical protein NE237_009699 [Protea cynaroides]